MSNDSDDDQLTFIEFDGESVVCRAAFLLHVSGVADAYLQSHPDFVTDQYLEGVDAAALVAVVELCLAGLWERADGGYRILDTATVDDVAAFYRRVGS